MKDISTQVLETKYVINLGQLLKIMPNIKRYIFNSVTFIQLVQPKPIQPKYVSATMTFNHQMVVIQVHAGKNFIDDVLIDGGFGVNIILRTQWYN